MGCLFALSLVLSIVWGHFPQGSTAVYAQAPPTQLQNQAQASYAPGGGLPPVVLPPSITTTVPLAPPPQLTIQKTVNQSTAAPGDTVNYQVVVRNTSTVTAATPVTVIDQLPVGFAYVEASIQATPNATTQVVNATNRTLTLTFATLPAGGTITVTYQVRIAADAPIGNGTNTAQVTTPGLPPVTATAQVNVTNTPLPSLQVEKTVNRDAAAVGDVVTYQVVVRNTSAVAATPVTIADQLPVGLAYVDGSIQATPNATSQVVNAANRTLTLTFATLPAGGTITVTYQVRITADAPGGNSVNTVQATTPGVAPVTDTAQVAVVPVPNPPPQLELVKTANRDAAAPGDVVNYQVVVRNTSAVAATPVTIADQLPVGLAYVDGSIQATPNATSQVVNAANRTLTLTFATLPAGGTITVNYQARIAADAPTGNGINTAQVTTPGVTPVTDTAQVAVVPVPNPPPQLQLVKTANRDVVAPGDVINYQVVITNPSGVAATPVTVTVQLPVGFIYVPNSVQTTPNAPARVEATDRTLILTFANLPAGESITVTYQVRVAADAPGGNSSNTAQATTPGVPPVTDTTQVTVVQPPNPPPQLQLVKTVNRNTATPGSVVNYQVVVRNTSAVAATPVTIADQLPVGFSYVPNSVQATPNAPTRVEVEGRTLTLGFTTLPAGGAITVNYQVQIAANAPGGNGINTAQATTPGVPPVTGTAQVTVNVVPPQLRIIKTSDRAAAEPGDVVVYRLVATNISEVVANPVTITDQLPLGMTYVPDSIQATPNPPTQVVNTGSSLRLTFGALSPGQSITVVYAVLMTPDAVRGDGRNIAQAAAPGATTVTATYQMTIRPGILADCGTIVGRVFVDKNFDGQQQPGEPGVPNAVVFMDDGNRILTDADGLFSLINVLPGYRVGTLDLYSMPGYTLAPNLFRIEENSVSRMVRLSPGGMARMNFAVTPTFGEDQS